ncbi:MAG: 23S rRNA (pseudouridine(1915)-N(3))-methyltransferase RlmH [Rhodobacteraceae bacterium]|nr:23S rRNA (pseudouridine(1915)-N(3))-methyltransferase RlmH [Paracoccaceae bacterium]
MRVHVIAVNRMRPGPELELLKRYFERFKRAGASLGFLPPAIHELTGTSAAHAARLKRILNRLESSLVVIVLDERGKQYTSRGFAIMLRKWRESGVRNLAFIIGGAGGTGMLGLPADVHRLSLGKMVFPHMLSRVLLAEQLYRATSILANTPYHRQ